MSKTRKTHSAEFKHRVALDALRDQSTMAELSHKYGVHVSQIQKWKDMLLKESLDLFRDKRRKSTVDHEKTVSALHEKIGKMSVELDFLERVCGRS